MTDVKAWKSSFKTFCTGRLFLTVAALKLIYGAIVSSHYLKDLFIPFTSYFIDSGYANPWTEFWHRGILDAFPHSTTMLASLALPLQAGAWLFHGAANIPPHAQLFLARLPIFLADMGIYLVLCRWLPTRWRQVLILYWCSPLVFYLNYHLGQLDVIPTALLILSIWYAVRLSPTKSGMFLALGLSAKHHLAAAVPLVAYYLWKKGSENRKPAIPWKFVFALVAGVVLLIGPLLGSEGYRALVLGAKESGWVYELAWTMPQGMKILVCPLALCALILHFFSYQRMTKDALILYSGLLYTILILLVPPKPGWAYWGFPFICYFLIRHEMNGYLPFWAYNIAFLAYYAIFSPMYAPASPFHRWSLDFPNGENLVFTLVTASLGLVAVWMYRVGVKSYVRYKMGFKTRAIGIGGDSASGKHTLADGLTSLLGPENTVRLHGDDYHRWPREHPAWKNQTHLDPRSNYFRQPVEHISDLKSGLSVVKPDYDHAKGLFTEPKTVLSSRFIVFEGLHPFVFQRMRDVFDVKIFVGTEESLRRLWKIRRDARERGYSENQVIAEIERRQQDSAQFIQPQEQFADWVLEYIRTTEVDSGVREGAPESSWLKARHRLSSQLVEIEDVVDELKTVPGLSSTWSMEPNLQRQVLEVQGEISAERIESIALKLLPELEDMAGIRPSWKADLQGINQLIFACLLFGLEKR